MDKLEKLSNDIWQGDASQVFLSEWRALAEQTTFNIGETIVKQLHPARYIYFLIDGEIEHSLALGASRSEVSLGGISLRFFPLGWSGFSAPFRYATSARAKTVCTLYRWQINDLNQLFYVDLAMGRQFFRYIFDRVLPLLNDARGQIDSSLDSTAMLRRMLENKTPKSNCQSLSSDQIREILGHSLFLEVFPELYLKMLETHARTLHFRQGEEIYQQGAESQQFMLLVAGAVGVSFTPVTSDKNVFLRSYSSVGQVVASTAFSLSGRHEEMAVAITDVTVLSINKSEILRLCESHPEFWLLLERRLLWLLSARLRTLRIQALAQHNDDEHVVIQDLLSQVSPQMDVSSKLYKLPHLLASRLTHAEALACLQCVKQTGTRLERTLASVCMNLLSELWRELAFYEGLHEVYQTVTQAPLDQTPESVRHLCNIGFRRVFDNGRFVIRGVEHLPDQPGNIFILNHLISHPYHALANGFELALDTHFVGAMILDPKYGDGGVRVVRRGRGEEHGHHNYYDRLGHIYVYTSESDVLLESEEERKTRRENFTQTAGDYLRDGLNLVICPEGTSNWGEDSPTEFKKGTFYLAAALNPEPLIVPIAVANFDKRLKNSAFAAVVHPPFRLTEKCDPHDKQSLTEFLSEFQQIYKGYVVEAQALAAEAAHSR